MGQLMWTVHGGKFTWVDGEGTETIIPFTRINFQPGFVLYESPHDGIVRGYRSDDIFKIEFDPREKS